MDSRQPVDILLLVWNRKEYTEKTLASVLEHTEYPYLLHIVDNGSAPKTADFLKEWVDTHSEVVGSFTRSPENEGLSPPTQRFWDRMLREDKPWWGKIDNDIEFSPGWLGRLVEVMEKCPSVGVASVCHYPEDFQKEVEADLSVIQEENGVRFLPRSHVGGCGYLIRADAVPKGRQIIDYAYRKMFGWTRYQHQINKMGMKTVYAYPLIPVRHLGEWRKQEIQTEEYQEYEEQIWEFRHGKRR